MTCNCLNELCTFAMSLLGYHQPLHLHSAQCSGPYLQILEDGTIREIKCFSFLFLYPGHRLSQWKALRKFTLLYLGF